MFTLIVFYAILSVDNGTGAQRSPEVKYHDFENKAACETAKRLTLSMAARIKGNGQLGMDRVIVVECTPKG